MKRIYRSNKHRVFAGVAGGLAEYFNIDPIIIRVLFLALTLGGGLGLFLYVCLWIVLPLQPEKISQLDAVPDAEVIQEEGSETKSNWQSILGGIFIILGVWILVAMLIPEVLRFVGPAILIIIGLLLIFFTTKNKK